MTRIGITAGVTREQTQAATDELRKLAREYAMSFDDVVTGLDTLVSSGLSLDEAMAFLPSVLKTAQATGSATEDIANTALKASSALKISAAEMEKAFDIMVAGGKAGQFELKDMAQHIPGLANSFATLGYKGEDGLKRLIAVLQTIREDTGSAEAAATQAQNIFGKMYSEETANKFKKFGIDLRKEMETARKSGKDALTAFTDLSNLAIKGDLTKLPLLFSDQEFRLGMQSLMTSPESLKRFLDLLNSADVEGTVLKDLGTVLDDTQAKIDRLSGSWDNMVKRLGEAAVPIASPIMDKIAEDTSKESAALSGFEKQGHTGGWAWWKMLNNMPIGTLRGSEEYERAAREGGYVPIDRPDLKQMQKAMPFAYSVLGRFPQRPISRPSHQTAMDAFQKQELEAFDRMTATENADAQRTAFQSAKDGDQPKRFSLIEAMRMDIDSGVFKQAGDQIKQGAAEGGQALGDEATRRLAAEASAIGTQIGQAVAAAIKSAVGNLSVNVKAPTVNANTGKQNPAAIAQPARLGHQ